MSEKEECLSVGKDFSRREWLMLIVILLFAEAGALIASHSFMSNQDVINYISFASTIASLILAILAIVYGFYQSESQKRTGDGIERHLINVRDTTGEMRDVSADLVKNAKGVEKLSLNIDTLVSALEQAHAKLSEIQGGISIVSQGQEVVAKTVSSMFDAVKSGGYVDKPYHASTKPAEALLLNDSNYIVDLVVFSLYTVFDGRSNVSVEMSRVAAPLAKVLVESEYGQKVDIVGWLQVIVFATSVLSSVGVLITSKTKDGVFIVSLKEDSVDVVSKSVEKTLSGPKRSVIAGKLKEALKDVKTTPVAAAAA